MIKGNGQFTVGVVTVTNRFVISDIADPSIGVGENLVTFTHGVTNTSGSTVYGSAITGDVRILGGSPTFKGAIMGAFTAGGSSTTAAVNATIEHPEATGKVNVIGKVTIGGNSTHFAKVIFNGVNLTGAHTHEINQRGEAIVGTKGLDVAGTLQLQVRQR